jgi:hypothetical protein
MGLYKIDRFIIGNSIQKPNPDPLNPIDIQTVENQCTGQTGDYYRAVLKSIPGSDSGTIGNTYVIYAKKKNSGVFCKLVATPCPPLCASESGDNFFQKWIKWMNSYFTK